MTFDKKKQSHHDPMSPEIEQFHAWTGKWPMTYSISITNNRLDIKFLSRCDKNWRDSTEGSSSISAFQWPKWPISRKYLMIYYHLWNNKKFIIFLKFESGKVELYDNTSFKDLSFIKNNTINLKVIFFKQLEFLKLELQGKLEFQESGKFLYISKIVVGCQIFWPTLVFSHFGHILVVSPSFLAVYQIFTYWLESENFLLRFIDKLFQICFLIGPNSLAQMNPSSTIIHSSTSWTMEDKPLRREFNISNSYKLVVRPFETHQNPH